MKSFGLIGHPLGHSFSARYFAEKFAAEGVPGEKTRLYRSVNSRNEEKIREELIIRLLRDKPSVTKLNRVLASVAQQVENRDESKWLFDFDCDDENKARAFIEDIKYLQRRFDKICYKH